MQIAKNNTKELAVINGLANMVTYVDELVGCRMLWKNPD